MTDWVVMKAPAKVNLSLRVLSKREDGYHEIETLFQMIDLCDTVRLTRRRRGLRLDAVGLEVPRGAENLVWRAAELVRSRAGLAAGVSIQIDKKIPVAAGLGGGSSDAAAVLLGLNRLYGLGWSRAELAELAAQIGSDVPFFLDGPVAIGRGRGEVLEPIRSACPFWLVLVTPLFPIRAAWAYGELSLPLTRVGPDISIWEGWMGGADFRALARHLHNDLEPVCGQQFPQILHLKSRLQQEGAAASLMSGSGPTVFGLFDTREGAHRCQGSFSSGGELCFAARAITEISEIRPGWTV